MAVKLLLDICNRTKLQPHLHMPLLGLMCKHLSYTTHYLEASWISLRVLQSASRFFFFFFFERLGAKLLSSISVCGETLLNIILKSANRTYPPWHCLIQAVEKRSSTRIQPAITDWEQSADVPRV